MGQPMDDGMPPHTPEDGESTSDAPVADAGYRRRLSFALAGLAAVALLALAGNGILAALSDATVEGHGPFPAFALPSLEDGVPIDEAILNDHVTVVNFWASWCPPCRSEAPVLRDIAQDTSMDRVQVLGVLHRDQLEPAREFVEQFSLTFPTVVDDGSLATATEVRTIPTTFVLDREGRILARHVGPIHESRLRVLIEDALAVSAQMAEGR